MGSFPLLGVCVEGLEDAAERGVRCKHGVLGIRVSEGCVGAVNLLQFILQGAWKEG